LKDQENYIRFIFSKNITKHDLQYHDFTIQIYLKIFSTYSPMHVFDVDSP